VGGKTQITVKIRAPNREGTFVKKKKEERRKC